MEARIVGVLADVIEAETDVVGLVRAVMSDPEVMATLPQAPRTPEEQVASAEHYIETYSAPWAETGYGGWAVCSRSDEVAVPPGTLLGFCGFEPGQLEGEGAELGFGYARAHWGKGIGSEASAAAVELLHLVHPGLHVRCEEHQPAARAQVGACV